MKVFDERRRCFRVSDPFFYVSILIALCAMVLFTRSACEQYHIPRLSILNSVTFVFDPLFLYAVSCLLLFWQIHAFLTSSKMTTSKFWPIFWAFLSVVALALSGYLVADVLLKPVFQYDRSPISLQLGEPWLIKLFVGSYRTGLDSCPSGFVIRQVFVYLTCLLLLNQNLGTVFSKDKAQKLCELFSVLKIQQIGRIRLRNLSFFWIQTLILIFVVFSRIYRGTHTFFDVGVSIGSGTYVYWLMVCSFLWFNKVECRFLPDIEYVSLIFIPLCFFYSRSAVVWTVVAALIISFLGIMYIYPNKFPKRRNTQRGTS